MGSYIAQAQLEARLGRATVRELLDDNNDGFADADPIAQVIQDAEAYVEGFLRPVYPNLPFPAPVPTEIVRLVLDVAVGYLCQRHPEVMRRDGDALLDRARTDLTDLRNGKTRLNVVGTSENENGQGAKNKGTRNRVESDDPNDRTPKPSVFIRGMGDF